MTSVENDFIGWLNQELERRGWSRSEAARRGSISSSMFDKVIGGFAQPGLDFCRGVARAFGLQLEDVLRKAGILPETGELIPEVRAWNVRLSNLTEEDRAAVIGVMEQTLLLMEMRPEYRARRGRKAGPGSTG